MCVGVVGVGDLKTGTPRVKLRHAVHQIGLHIFFTLGNFSRTTRRPAESTLSILVETVAREYAAFDRACLPCNFGPTQDQNQTREAAEVNQASLIRREAGCLQRRACLVLEMSSYEGSRQFLQKESSDGVSLYSHLANVLLKVNSRYKNTI